jgi:site-specific recombinase XerD
MSITAWLVQKILWSFSPTSTTLTSVQKSQVKAAERCGLNVRAQADGLAHTLKHYVASKLLANGVEMMVVSRILGHESIKPTVDIYGHIQDNQRRQALTSLA